MASREKNQLGVDLPEPDRPAVDKPDDKPDNSVDRPDWLPENFKDPSEFANAYKEAQTKIKEQGDNQKRLEGQIANLTQVVEGLHVEDKPQQQTGDFREQIQAAYENDPVGTIAYLAQQAAQQTVDERMKTLQEQNSPAVRASQEAQNQLLAMTVDRAMGDKFEDWGEYKDKVGGEIAADPSLLPEQIIHSPELIVRSLSRVYENLKAHEILEQAKTGNFVTSQMKMQAQTLTGAGVRQPEDATAEKIARLQEAAKGLSYSSMRSNK